MPIVPAKCTQCGANIDIDSDRDAGICQYCGTAFITEKAINHFNNTYNIQNATIHVSGVDIENLLIRAVQFEKKNDREKALEYYNRVLDIDAFRVEALEGIERLSQVYFGKVVLKHDEVEKLQYLIKQGDELEAIRQIRILTGLSLVEAKNYVDNFIASGKWFASNLKSAPTIHSTVQSSFDSLNATMPKATSNKAQTKKEKKKGKKGTGFRIWGIVCAVLSLIYVIISFEQWYYISAAGCLGIMSTMFFVLSKSPKTSKYLLGRPKGLRKGIFIVLCLVLAGAFVKTIDGMCDHTYIVTNTIPATVEEVGKIEETCLNCGKGKTTTLDKVEHDVPAMLVETISSPRFNAETDYVISIEELVDEINADINAAKLKYNDTRIEITGSVTFISESAGMTGFYLYGTRGGEGLNITCWVYDDSEQDTSHISVGDKITFIGTLREVTTFNNTEIGECIIKSYGK